jgi:hypothetical protein
VYDKEQKWKEMIIDYIHSLTEKRGVHQVCTETVVLDFCAYKDKCNDPDAISREVWEVVVPVVAAQRSVVKFEKFGLCRIWVM